MQVSASFPISSQPSASRKTFPVAKQEAKSAAAAQPQPSSVVEFAEAAPQDGARFSRYGDFDANTKAALSRYQATELLATNNPTQQLIGVDVFA